MYSKGDLINERYEIKKNIGEGGMANVYLAHDKILDRDVAVKVLRGDLADDEKFVRRFQREAISASSLSHPNIVEMYDVGEDDGKYFIVMEYVNGKTLKSLIKRRGNLTVEETIDIMLQLTSGMACAHDSYIIHRDLKPQNVLMLEDGTAKITDFGIAMALNSTELTQTNTVMGSVHYLPPEQANGSGSTIKSDIYSLGIMMYEMLVGKVPFKGDNAVEIAIKQIKDQIPSVCKINPSIPQSVENIILKATAKNPKNRYDSAYEMHEDLKNALKESHKEDQRLTYAFPEHEVTEVTKIVPKEDIKNKLDEMEENEIKTKKKNGNLLFILGISAVILATIFIFIVVIYPAVARTKEVLIPDVSGMSRSEAVNALEDKGLVVREEVEKRHDNEIKEDLVIKTDPKANANVKVGSKVTLYISLGSKQIEIEDYVGKNYLEVKGNLEALGLVVIIETEEVEDDDLFKENVIIKQDIEDGTKVEEGDTITLTVQELVEYYPDFTAYTLQEVKEYCDDHNVELVVTYVESDTEPDGKIIYQNYSAGTYKVLPDSQTLRIKVVGSNSNE